MTAFHKQKRIYSLKVMKNSLKNLLYGFRKLNAKKAKLVKKIKPQIISKENTVLGMLENILKKPTEVTAKAENKVENQPAIVKRPRGRPRIHPKKEIGTNKRFFGTLKTTNKAILPNPNKEIDFKDFLNGKGSIENRITINGEP